MKKTRILYWVFTSLFAFVMLGSAIPDILLDPIAIQGIHKEMGYPVYFIPFVGVMKALGAITILVPVNRRVKEWAYAGLIFDLVAATYSLIAGGLAANALAMPVFLALAVASYLFYHKKLRMEDRALAANAYSKVSAGIA